jgi:hypothetical protein
MLKKIGFLVLFLSLVLVGCQKSGDKKITAQTVVTDVCQEITADFVYSATGKTVVKVEAKDLGKTKICNYYFSEKSNDYLSVRHETNLSVENQKTGVEFLDGRIEQSDKINMEHMVAYNEKNLINNIYLILDPMTFFSIDRGTKDTLTDEQLIDFAAKLADKIQGKTSIEIKANPIKFEKQGASEAATQEQLARQFFDNIAQGKYQEAVAMMDANQGTKDAWVKNFETLKSLKLEKIDEAFKAEWSATRQSFKATLTVEVKPGSPDWGWQNGKNFRWLVLQKTGGVWQVHELNNNP